MLRNAPNCIQFVYIESVGGVLYRWLWPVGVRGIILKALYGDVLRKSHGESMTIARYDGASHKSFKVMIYYINCSS